MAPFVGTIEIVCGGLVLIGLATRLAVIPLMGVILLALYTTKIPMISGSGIWSTLHEARSDVSMLLGLIFLALAGGGSIAVDDHLSLRRLEGKGASIERGSASNK
jgi:putative oxidoreductase